MEPNTQSLFLYCARWHARIVDYCKHIDNLVNTASVPHITEKILNHKGALCDVFLDCSKTAQVLLNGATFSHITLRFVKTLAFFFEVMTTL